MGNNNNAQSLNQQEIKTHQRLGLIKMFGKQNNSQNQDKIQYFIELKRNLPNQKVYENWLKQFRQIQSQFTRDLIYLPLQYKYQQTAMCGSSGQAKLTFQYFPYVLKTQIKNRRKMNQYFQQTELWYLLYNLVQSGTLFQQNNKKLGDLNSNNCLLNQIGQMKIIATCSMPGQTTNYQKIVQSVNNDVYLAPQQIDSDLLQKGIYPKVNQKKTQIYSIGMILLQAASLQDCFYVYNRGPYKINKNKLNEYLKIVKGKYSQILYEYLKNMLQEQPNKRKNSSQIFKFLYPYESQILDLRPFSFIKNSQWESKFYLGSNQKDDQNTNKDKILETTNLGLNSFGSPYKNFALGIDSNSIPVQNQNINSFNKPFDNLALNSFNKPFDNLALNSFNKPFDNLALNSYAKPIKINMNNPEKSNNRLNLNDVSSVQKIQKKQLSGIKSQDQHYVQHHQNYRRQFI